MRNKDKFIKNSNVSDVVATKIFREFFFANIGRCSMWDEIELRFFEEFRTPYCLEWLNAHGEELEKEWLEKYNPAKLAQAALTECGGDAMAALEYMSRNYSADMGWKDEQN